MIAWTDLLLPALLAAVLVFLASSVIHMVLKLHNPDYRKLPDEDAVREALRKGSPGPGQYIVPHCLDPKEMADPAMQQRFEEGPVGVIYLRPTGMTKLGPFLGKWFVYTLVVGLIAGYVGRAALGPGAPYLDVFQVVGAAAWLGYAWSSPAESIWKGVPWIVTVRTLFDGLVYAALTAGCYAWLWPG